MKYFTVSFTQLIIKVSDRKQIRKGHGMCVFSVVFSTTNFLFEIIKIYGAMEMNLGLFIL